MSINVGELDVKVRGDTRDAEQGLDQVEAGLKEIEEQAAATEQSLTETAEALTETGAAAADTGAAAEKTAVGLEGLQKEAREAAAAVEEVKDQAKQAAPALDAVGKAAPAAAMDTSTRGISQTSGAIEGLRGRAKGLKSDLGAAARSLTLVAGEAGGTTARVAGLASALTTGVAAGGALGVGLGLLVGGFQALQSSIAEAAAEASQFRAMQESLGTTAREVRDLERAFRMAGNELDRGVIQKLIIAASEAGVTTVELAAMADEIKRLQDLTGMDAASAAARVAQDKAKDSGDDYIDTLKRIAAARDDQIDGISAWQRAHEDGARRDREELEALQRTILRTEQDRGRAIRVYGVESDESQKLLDTLRAHWKRREELRKRLADANRLQAQLETQDEVEEGIKQADAEIANYSRKRAASEADARRSSAERKRATEEEARALEERARLASDMQHRTRMLTAQETADRKAEINALADHEIEQQRKAVEGKEELQAGFDEWERARNAQRRQELAEVDEARFEASQDLYHRIRQVEARADGDRRAMITAAADAEIAQYRRMVEQKKLTEEEFMQWRVAREQQMRAELQANQEAEIAAGMNAATNFLTGLQRGIENDDPKEIFKSLLQAGAQILGIFVPGAGQIASAGIGMLTSLFHDGGIAGTGGRKLPKYHSGGMLVAHRGVMIPEPGPGEVPIMGQIGEGVLSRMGVAAAGGPAAVQAYNEGRQPGGSGGGSSTVINVQALLPATVPAALGRLVEPAQHSRSVARADTKMAMGLHRQMAPPRSTR